MKTSVSEVYLLKGQVQDLVRDFNKIEMRDGEKGFNSGELRAARKTLERVGIAAPGLTSKGLKRFAADLKAIGRKIPEGHEEVWRDVRCNGDPLYGGGMTLALCLGNSAGRFADVIEHAAKVTIEGCRGGICISGYSFEEVVSDVKGVDHNGEPIPKDSPIYFALPETVWPNKGEGMLRPKPEYPGEEKYSAELQPTAPLPAWLNSSFMISWKLEGAPDLSLNLGFAEF